MHSNIEQAVADVVVANKPVTVANTFPIYMRVAGFGALCEEAIVAFEHALDKHPMRSLKAHIPYTNAILRLRSEYWYDKLGSDAIECLDESCVECRRAGISIVDGQMVLDDDAEVEKTNSTRLRKKRPRASERHLI